MFLGGSNLAGRGRSRSGVLTLVLALVISGVAAIGPTTSVSQAAAEDEWRALAVGHQMVCGVDASGRAWCWGNDLVGQLGNGTVLTGIFRHPSLVEAPGVTFVDIAAGQNHVCAIDDERAGWCWGSAANGKLGNGSTYPDRHVPVPMVGGHEWSSIDAGLRHTCAIDTAGAAWCWGSNQWGQLGTGTAGGEQTAPVAVSLAGLPTGITWRSISTGSEHTCAVTTTDRGYCWGRGDDGRLGRDKFESAANPVQIAFSGQARWVEVSAGADHTCGFVTSGSGYCWGNDSHGELGNGSAVTTNQAKPTDPIPGNWKKIDAGSNGSCAIAQNDDTYCWGHDSDERLGNGPGTDLVHTPLLTAAPNGYVAVGVGTDVVCGVTANDIHCSGQRGGGRVGDGLTSPARADVPVSVAPARLDQQITFGPLEDRVLGSGAFEVAATATSGLPVSFSGVGLGCVVSGSTVTVTGLGACTVFADQSGDDLYRAAPRVARTFQIVPNSSPGTWSRVAVGYVHTCAVTQAGALWCWGADESGQVGNGPNDPGVEQYWTPVAIEPPAGLGEGGWQDVRAGHTHNCGLSAEGDVFCWGENTDGQLGPSLAVGVNADAPVLVPRVAGMKWLSVAAGRRHSCAIAENGKAFCWGRNLGGELGNWTTDSSRHPVQVLHPNWYPGWASIDAGDAFTCGVDTAGVAHCWGAGGDGRLAQGNTDTGGHVVPVPVKYQGYGIDAVAPRNVVANGTRGCLAGVITEGESAGPVTVPFCWGDGQLFAAGSAPAPGQEDLTATGVGTGHRCHAMGATSHCTGDNGYGQLGTGIGMGAGQPLGGHTWRAFAAGRFHTCGITTTGDLRCWGYSFQGQIGIADPLPIQDVPAFVRLPQEPGGMLRVTTDPPLPSSISVDGVVRDTWALTWMRIDSGPHEVCFSDVTGFATPDCETVVVPEGGTGSLVGDFTPLAALRVTTSPAVASTISIDGVPVNDWGVYTYVPAGRSVEVCWGPVTGYNSPPCQIVAAANLTEGGFHHVTGDFVGNPGVTAPWGHGFLRVTTTPAVATTIVVDGIARDTWGLDWMKIAPGTHEVCFTDAIGFATPDCEVVTVTTGETATVDGAYQQLGWLRAITAPSQNMTIAVNGVDRNNWGIATPLVPGSYHVCYKTYGSSPQCQTATVAAGATTEVTGP